jgi:hypothetical protein
MMHSEENNIPQRRAPLAQRLCLALLLAASVTVPARAQSAKLQLDRLQGLANRAERVTNVTLDQQLLQLAIQFMSNGGDQQARQLAMGLKGVYVKSFKFSKPGEYSQQDVKAILSQLHAAPWEQIVSSQDAKTHETDGVYILTRGNMVRGLAVISAGPTQLTVVNIVGSIDLKKLSELEGHFGIPHMKLKQTGGPN